MTQPPTLATFPTVTGSNLNQVSYTLPADFESGLNIVVLAFYQPQQREVDTWLPTLRALEEGYPDVRFYELPTLTRANGLFRAFIDGGMRSGIRDTDTRSRTITLYLDRAAFMRALGLASDRTIYTLLVRRSGEVLWRASGPHSDANATGLEMVLARAEAADSP